MKANTVTIYVPQNCSPESDLSPYSPHSIAAHPIRVIPQSAVIVLKSYGREVCS